MRDYGKVHASFWSSRTIRALSNDGRLLALYLITCQHATIAGVFRLPSAYAAEDLGWTPQRFEETLSELFENGFAQRCETTMWLWVKKPLVWNRPENPNQTKAVLKLAKQVPDECGWRAEFIAQVEGLPKASVTLSKPEAVAGTETGTEAGEGGASAEGRPSGAKRPRKDRFPLPEGFAISTQVREWAGKHGFDRLDDHLEHFRLACRKGGYEYADWDAALMDAIRDDWAKLRAPAANAQGSPDLWWTTIEGMKRKARQVGVKDRPGESRDAFRERIQAVIEQEAATS